MNKIAFTCNRLGTGGAERVICNLSNRMNSDDISVDIICLDILPNFYYELKDNVRIIELDKDISKRKNLLSRKLFGIRNLWRLYKHFKNERPDIVITFYTRQNCYSILCCKLLGIPVIAAERDHFFLQDNKMNHRMRKLFYHKADGFIHQTQWAKDYLEDKYNTTSNAIILENPLWMNEFPKREPIKDRVIAIGRLAEQKNYKGLILAFKIVVKSNSDARLYIYGDGNDSEIESLNSVIRINELTNNVFLMGHTDNVTECYRTADIFVLFSNGEGYPNVLMEALAVGVPSIASDCPVGGPKAMIRSGENGILVSNGNYEELASAIITLLEDNQLKTQFSRNAINIRKTNGFENVYRKLYCYLESFKH